MKKGYLMAALAAAISLGSVMTSFAGWQLDTNGYWWQNDDGSYPTNSWQWLDGNGDGVAECYYFDGNGYMLANTTTPDGYQVNADGAWVELGIVRTRPAETPTPIETSENGSIPSGYNEDGISNIVIDMLEHTRAENAKYGESRTDDAGGDTYVFYDNYGLRATYFGLTGTESLKPEEIYSASATNIFTYAPLTGDYKKDYNELKNNGFDVTTNGGSAEVLCGKYGLHLHATSKNAKAFIRFDYR